MNFLIFKYKQIGTIIGETKREGQRKAKNNSAHKNQKKKKELVLLVVGSYVTYGPSNVTYMQIVKLISNGRSRTHITHQCNLLLYTKVKAR
jgi:hypothetical protein